MADSDQPPIGLDLASAEALMAEHFPEGLGAKVQRRPEEMVLSSGPLTEAHLAANRQHIALGAPTLGSADLAANPIRRLRHTHHRMAQLVAMGMSDKGVAALCGVTPGYVYNLQQDPAFQDLLAGYAGEVRDEFTDFVTAAAALSMDMVERLREILEESPEKLTSGQVMEALRILADRTGHAPVTKSIAVNVNADVGSRLRAAQERLARQGIEAGG